jgi:DNA-binding protein HU-beta
MHKAELVEKVAATGLSKKAAEAAIDAFTQSIVKALKKGETVTLVGFGSFKVVKRKARTGVNPQTKEKIKIKAKKVPKFVPGRAFKEAVQ